MKQTCLFHLRLFLFILFIIPTVLTAQDIIVKVKQGSAKLGSQNLLESTASVTMKSTDVLDILPRALVIARQDVIMIELPSGKEHSYSSILAMLKKKKQAASGTVSTIAFKDPILKANPTPLKGSSTRGNGEGDKPNFYYPYDNMLVYDSPIVFFIGTISTVISSKVVLKNTATNEIYYNAIPDPELNHFTVTHLPEGDYEWTYSIKYYNLAEEVSEDFKNIFKVPSENEKKELAKKVESFKKELKDFSPEMQHLLLLEYCVENGIYHKLH
jgi:hypothetical protein